MINIERFSLIARFVRSAVEAGAHVKPASLSPNYLWERNVDITITYVFGAYEGKENKRFLTLEEVGKIFPREKVDLTRERVRQVVNKTIEGLWHHSTVQLQQEYPLEKLQQQINKPQFLTHKEGTTRNILEDLDQGADYFYLRSKYSEDSLSGARKILAKYGRHVPYTNSREETKSFLEELKKIDPKADNQTLKRLLDQVDNNFMDY